MRQLAELVRIADVTVFGIRSAMFGDRPANPVLVDELDRLGLELEWAPDRISADVIVLHNPLFLKFQSEIGARLVCKRLIVVTHENFLLPGGREAFDVSKCLSIIESATICAEQILAPVSERNRRIVQSWLDVNDTEWRLSNQNWINICDNVILPPTLHPRDRRGRHSRPESEKFPSFADLRTMFPETAEYCGIMGGDRLGGPDKPKNWDLIPFNGKPVAEFLRDIDFFVYFTNPCAGESFGMVLAEAVAAGKLVITDALSAQTFGEGVIGTSIGAVGSCIARHIEDRSRYGERVRLAQAGLAAFSGQKFRDAVLEMIG